MQPTITRLPPGCYGSFPVMFFKRSKAGIQEDTLVHCRNPLLDAGVYLAYLLQIVLFPAKALFSPADMFMEHSFE